MNVLPRILYLLQAIPIALPQSFLTAVKQCCRVFLWAGRSPRLSWDKLIVPKLKGGLGLPDITLYHRACQLVRVVDWHLHAGNKDWVAVENEFLSFPITHLPWIEAHSVPKPCMEHPLIGPTIRNFRTVCRKSGLSPSPGPMTPLILNPDFPPSIAASDPTVTPDPTQARASHFFRNGTLLSQTEMTSALPQLTIPFFKFLQIRHFLGGARTPMIWSRDLAPIEQICATNRPQRHLISALYSLLLSKVPPTDQFQSSWNSDLSLDLSDEDWDRIWEHAHKGSVNVSAQENRYKLCTRWYRTPEKLHKIFPAVPAACWRCGKDTGSLLHIWWDCPVIVPFWKAVHESIIQITTYYLEFSPAQYLLHHTVVPRNQYRKSLTLHLVNAATQCVPLRWKSTSAPTLHDWHLRVQKIDDMEQLIHRANDTHDKYRETWACWTHYRESGALVGPLSPTDVSTNLPSGQ